MRVILIAFLTLGIQQHAHSQLNDSDFEKDDTEAVKIHAAEEGKRTSLRARYPEYEVFRSLASDKETEAVSEVMEN